MVTDWLTAPIHRSFSRNPAPDCLKLLVRQQISAPAGRIARLPVHFAAFTQANFVFRSAYSQRRKYDGDAAELMPPSDFTSKPRRFFRARNRPDLRTSPAAPLLLSIYRETKSNQ